MSEAGLIDISPSISAATAVWPGDTPFSRTVNASFAGGANLDLSEIRTTVHVGAHTDAPSHYRADGVGIDARPLDLYFGPCLVVRVDVGRGERVRPAHLPGSVRERESLPARLLLATGTFPDPDHFNEDFAALSPELISWSHERGVRLIGLDTPSVDLCRDAELLTHNAIADRDMAILEGVVLGHVEPGEYTLIALPLRLADADASPVRAALLPR